MGYRDALRVREFRAILSAYLVSVLGDTCAYLAVTVLVYARTRSALLAALTFAVAFAPQVVGATLLSGLVDRLRPKTIVVGFDLAAGFAVATMAVPGMPLGELYAVLFAVGALSPVRSGTLQAVVADAVPREAYVPARSALRICAQLAQVAGLGVGGGVVALLGARGALLADAASFGVSAAIGLVYVRARPPGREPTAPLLHDSLRGLRQVWAHPEPRRLVLLGWVVPFVAVAPEALAAPGVAQSGHRPALVAVWMGVIPAGLVVGDLLAVTVLGPRLRQRTVVPLAAGLCLSLAAFLLRPPFPAAVALLTTGGLLAAYTPGLDQRLRDSTEPALLARTLTVSGAGLMAVQGLGFVAAGAVAERVPVDLTIGIFGILGLAGVFVLMPSGRRAAPEGAALVVGPGQSSQGP